MFDPFGTRTKQVLGRDFYRFEEPDLGLVHRLNRPIIQNVPDVNGVSAEVSAHEHRSVASDRVFLGT